MTNVRDPRLPTAPPLIWSPFGDLETAITIRSSFSARDPSPSKDYGVGGVVFRFYVRGPFGAVDWDLHTDWYLPEVHDEWRRQGLGNSRGPSAGAVTLHQAHQRWLSQEPQMECHTGIKPCYGDVSFLGGDVIYERLLREGHDGVWGALGEWYFELDPERWDDRDEAVGSQPKDES